jgi:hypothetical protein
MGLKYDQNLERSHDMNIIKTVMTEGKNIIKTALVVPYRILQIK